MVDSVEYNPYTMRYIFTTICDYCKSVSTQSIRELDLTFETIQTINKGYTPIGMKAECDNCRINPFVQELK